MSWNLSLTGTRDELEEAVNTTADCPDSVRAFVANAGAYYDEDTQLEFSTSGHAHEGKIANCEIHLVMSPLQATQLPADEDAEASQLPAEPPHPEQR